MREIEGLSYEEMAQAMNVSKGTIMSRLFHARQKLQRALADCYAEQLGPPPVESEGEETDEPESSAADALLRRRAQPRRGGRASKPRSTNDPEAQRVFEGLEQLSAFVRLHDREQAPAADGLTDAIMARIAREEPGARPRARASRGSCAARGATSCRRPRRCSRWRQPLRW